MNTIKPIQNKERIEYLDILRGIAILFIYVANIIFFSGWVYLSEQSKINLGDYSIDFVIEYLQTILVQGKFYSVFSILFGIGFAIQFNKLKNSEKQFISLYTRRMFGLLIIGLIHLTFFWSGDILALYALLGFLLICFRNHTDKQILIWGFVFLFLPVVNRLFIHFTEFYYYRTFFQLYQTYLSSLEGMPKDVFLPFYQTQTESLSDFFKLNFGNFFRRLGHFLFESRQFKVFGCFLIGVWFGRKILNENILENIKFLKKTVSYGLLIGIPTNIFMEFCGRQRGDLWAFLEVLSYSIGVISLACAYSAIVAILLRSKYKFLNFFIPVGRMALTNYLLQTFVSIFLFYGIGLGFGTNLSLTKTMLILLLVFTFQVIFSWLWLKKFKYGPFEWIWRVMTYGKLFATRK